jgi:transposase
MEVTVMDTVTVMGCDPHLDTISVSVMDLVGRELAAVTVSNDRDGWCRAAELAHRMGVRKVGIEGASGYGVNLSRVMSGIGFEVLEIPTRLTARRRRVDGAGKTDPGDARTIARTVTAGEGHRWADTPNLETIRLLVSRRDQLIKTQTGDINYLRSVLADIAPHLAATLGRVRSRRRLTELANLEMDGPTPYQQQALQLIADTAHDCIQRLEQIRRIETELDTILPPVGRQMIDQIPGCGLITATQILAQLAGTTRTETDARFAAWSGIAPLDASSGRQQRHRLNTGGNRQLNRAIHTIVTTQARHHGQAHHYITRRMSEGKTRKEAIRAAKRHVARNVWKLLRNHQLT